MRKQGSVRGFCAGIVVGVMIGSAGLSAAAFGYKGWDRFSQDFKVGYITGFLEMANLARNLDPGGYIDIKYPMVPNTKPMYWAHEINRLYADPENRKYSITSILQLAAHELEKQFGKAQDPQERVRRRMEQQLEAIRRKREAMGLEPKDPKKQVLAPEKVEAAPKKPAEAAEPAPPKQKKWCRCDGKDPQVERARRRAEAPAREKREEQEFLEWVARQKAGNEADGKKGSAAAPDAEPAAEPEAASPGGQ